MTVVSHTIGSHILCIALQRVLLIGARYYRSSLLSQPASQRVRPGLLYPG